MKLVLILLLISCQVDDYSNLDCEKFARETYRGLPKSAHKFKKYCSKRELNWSTEKCKQALKDLILGKSKKYLETNYGKVVMECYSQKDLEKFGQHLK